MLDEQPSSQLVVVGSSAGGIEALSTLVATLPAGFHAPLVIAQHLAPDHVSHLGDILARRSTLPVRTVTDREALTPGVVFVVPPNRHVTITDQTVELGADGDGGPTPSVDLLLVSAAQVFGERLIAVVLTGMGHDGAAGARAVHEAGGTVIIQDPETARFPAMPLSLAPTTVDIVASVEQIGPLLHTLLTGAQRPLPPDEDRSLRALLDQVHQQSGIDFTGYKLPTILRRLHRRMAATKTDSLDAYLRYAQGQPDEYQRLARTFLIKVTEFFRDRDLFDELRAHILPQLIDEARHGNELRLWSAGCATGEEAYSLAILVSELLGDEIARFNVRVFATDLDPEAIAFARRGVYPAAALAGLPPELAARYFSEVAANPLEPRHHMAANPLEPRNDVAYEVRKGVRALTVFGYHDLGQRAPFPRIDLVLCRNVLIYFTTEVQRRALDLFAFALRQGGFLVLGKAETAGPLPECFVPVERRLKVYRRQGARVTDSTPPPRPPAILPHRLPTAREQAVERLRQQTQRIRNAGERVAETRLLNLPAGVVVVNRRYDIQGINAAARRLLGIHGEAVGEDIVHLAQGVPPAPLRAAIDAAFRGDPRTTVEDVLMAEAVTGEARYLQITCSAEAPAQDGGPVETVVLLVVEVTKAVSERQALEQAVARQQEEAARQQEMLERLMATNRELLAANDALAGANADLHSSNEELLVGYEELQAATEEVETLNEEMQATNEELETLNEEMQATNEELQTTNDDLAARGLELEDLAATLADQRRTSEAERAQLAAILVSMHDAVLATAPDGTAVVTNAAYEETFGSGAGAAALEDEHEQPLPPDATPQRRATRGEAFSMQFSLRTDDGGRRWFEADSRPIRGDGGAQGTVLVIREITERSLRRLQEAFVATASHELRTPLTALQGYLQLLVRRLPAQPEGDARVREYSTLALSQAQRLVDLVRDLLDVSRLQGGKLQLALERIDLVPLVTRAVALAQALAEGQQIALDAPAGPVLVTADAGRLEQVVLNLLTNAITYAPGTERIEVRLRRVPANSLEPRHEIGGAVELEVQDFGVGIPAADMPHVLERFYQASDAGYRVKRGLGIGLFIANEIVTAHGGALSISSVEGEGSTFTVRLPVGDAEVESL